MRHFKGFFKHIQDLGFHPGTIIDVGVADHTKEMYESFPDAYYVLIEPLQEFESDLKSILNTYSGEYHLCAASNETCEKEFFVNTAQLHGSSLCFANIADSDSRLRKVRVDTLDNICNGKKLKTPVMIKTDVQGQDLNVMRGAKKLLQDTEVIILEIPMFGPWGGGDEFTDYIVTMKEFGFVAYDIVGYLKRPYDQALSHLDVAFVKDNGKFRAHRLFN